MLESNKMEEEVNKMEEEANKMEEEANKMDEEANKMDEEANKMDETTIKMDTNANEIDQNTNKMVKEANKMDKAKNHNRQAGLSSKPGGTLNIPQTTQCCKTSDCSDYQGTEARTRNGNACRPWLADDKIKLRNRGLLKDPHNHCRNVSPGQHRDCTGTLVDTETAWCWTVIDRTTEVYKGISWEYCDLPKCSQDCCATANCFDYRGTQAFSMSGNDCLPWTDHWRSRIVAKEPNLATSANFCRNPNAKWRPWCYVQSGLGGRESDSCQIALCSDPKCVHVEVGIARNFIDLTVLSTVNGGQTLIAQRLVNEGAAFPKHTYKFTPCGQRKEEETKSLHPTLQDFMVLQEIQTSANAEVTISGIGINPKLELLPDGSYALKMSGQDGTSTIINLKCGAGTPITGAPNFQFIKEEPMKTYHFDLTHVAACVERIHQGTIVPSPRTVSSCGSNPEQGTSVTNNIREIDFDCEKGLGGSLSASGSASGSPAEHSIDDSATSAWSTRVVEAEWRYEFGQAKKITIIDINFGGVRGQVYDVGIYGRTAERRRYWLDSHRFTMGQRPRLQRFEIRFSNANHFKKYIIKVKRRGAPLTSVYNVQMFEALDRTPNCVNLLTDDTTWMNLAREVRYESVQLNEDAVVPFPVSLLLRVFETKRQCPWKEQSISFTFARKEVIHGFIFDSEPGKDPTNYAVYQTNKTCSDTESLRLLATFDETNVTRSFKFCNVESASRYCFKIYHVSGYSKSASNEEETVEETVLLKNPRFMRKLTEEELLGPW